MKDFKTEQENFWAGTFGNDYIERNRSENLLASNLHFFSQALKNITNLSSVVEFGANIGMNIKAIQLLFPKVEFHAVEINAKAARELAKIIDEENIFVGSVLEYESVNKFDLVLVKTVLIHINPEMLPEVYEKIYSATNRYILVCEYYNPNPVTVNYRGHSERLFKRDFAGDLLDKYADLELVDYGFSYKRDNVFPQDDISWFLLKKKNMI